MLTSDKAVLVIVDVQGKLAALMKDKEILFENLVRMAQGAKVLGIPIIWNEQVPEKLGETIAPLKEVLTDNAPLAKVSFSCCGNPAFMEKLRAFGRKQVILVGIETHICVYQTALDLIKNDYEIHLVVDAVSSRHESNRRVGIERMKEAGAILTTVEMSLFEMLGRAEGEKFRQIAKIVK
jgi:nicotinamidase-related amidase